MRILSLVILAFVFTGCDAVSSDEPIAVAIQTDTDAYVLEHLASGHRFTMRIEVVNEGDTDIYLGRMCGVGDAPVRTFHRVPASDVPVLLDLGTSCALPGGIEASAPIRVARGATYTDEVEFYSSFVQEGPYTNRDTKTGAFQVEYVVFRARRIGSRMIYDPLPGTYTSNVFQVDMAN